MKSNYGVWSAIRPTWNSGVITARRIARVCHWKVRQNSVMSTGAAWSPDRRRKRRVDRLAAPLLRSGGLSAARACPIRSEGP
jgi:hypothetical protein